jgi:MFS family permease
MSALKKIEAIAALGVIAVCGCALAATGMVLFGHTPEMFNSGRRANHLVTQATFIFLPVVMALLCASFFSVRARRFRQPILLVFVVFATIEIGLPLVDHTLISVKNSKVPGASYNVRVPDGEFYLSQPTATSTFGFRTPEEEPKRFNGRRILMLGSSFVWGTGSTFATNYPQALQAFLKQHYPDQPISVMSAGVGGIGVVEDRMLYEYLVQQGYHFDEVILNFYLGGDQTNNIAGTDRIAIAGRAQRVHSDPFLRTFFPLNTNIYRFAVYLYAAFNQNWGTDDPAAGSAVVERDATCVESPGFQAFSTERAAVNYSTAAKAAIDMSFNQSAIQKLGDEVAKNGSHFGIVLLPDAGALLQVNRSHFASQTMDWNWIRNYFAANISTRYPVVDLSDSFRERPDYFRCDDTHWNDKGNVAGAEVVANFVENTLWKNE